MNNFEMRSFLTIGAKDSINSLKVYNQRYETEVYEFTNNGVLLYPIGTPIPVIRKSKGCIGLAVISEITITANTTKVRFEFNEDISSNDKIAYFNLYRNQVSSGNTSSSDIYDSSEDVIIPGALGSININNSEPKVSKRKKNHYFDDDDDDDYDPDPFKHF